MVSQSKSLLKSQCHLCHVKSSNLQRCSRCKVVWYCNREHQATDRETHKRACNAIAKSRTRTEEEEQELRDFPGDMFTAPNPFETAVGHFWGVLETRDYMRTRFSHVEALLEINTAGAVQAALDHMMDMLRLCRSDNMGVRDLVPALMLRLDQDQEAYDFMKWWAVISEDSHYDWGDTDLPYMDIKNADVFEPIHKDLMRSNWLNIKHANALLLLKVKLLLDLTALHNTEGLNSKLPPELLDEIRKSVPRSPIVRNNRQLIEGQNVKQTVEKLIAQIDELYDCIKKNNPYVWPAFLNPAKDLEAKPMMYSAGTREDMQLMLRYNYRSWLETPQALDFINAKTRRAKR